MADGLALASLSFASRLTHLGDVPSVMAMASIVRSAKHVEVAGEALAASVVVRVVAVCTLHNNYGPTEVTVDVTGKHVSAMEAARRLSSIGRPLQRVSCDVMSPTNESAQALGVWGVSAFIGSTSGPLIAAPLLAYYGWTEKPDHYSFAGYVAVNLAGALYVLCAGLFLRFVKAR